MTQTLAQLADLVGGVIAGDPNLQIVGAAPFESAGEGEITLALDRHYISRLDQTRAAAVIVPLDAAREGKDLLKCSRPKVAFAKILDHFTRQPFQATGISKQAFVGERCRISPEVSIHPFVHVGSDVGIESGVTLYPGVVIGNGCHIGRDSVLRPNVTLYPGVRLGARVIVHSGTVIGADGFGYAFDGSRQVKIPQLGSVEIGDDVEIGANCCIDRATFGTTRLEHDVKLDNLVHIAHNCHIGANTVIVGCVGVSGSVEIGENCVFAGQSGVSDHVRIGDRVTVLAKSAVTRDIPAGSTVSGIPARDHREELRSRAALRQLPDLVREVRRLRRILLSQEGDRDRQE